MKILSNNILQVKEKTEMKKNTIQKKCFKINEDNFSSHGFL